MRKRPKPIKRTAPPLSDEELAAAEMTANAKQQAHIDRLEDEEEQTRLANAGEPETLAALSAGASILSGRPVEGEEPPPVPKLKPKKRIETDPPEKPLPKDGDEAERAAFKLMDGAFRKWRAKSDRNPREAFRELARDLGQDISIYIQAGIMRMNDVPDLLLKLTALGKTKDETSEGDGDYDYDKEMDHLRNSLRGGK